MVEHLITGPWDESPNTLKSVQGGSGGGARVTGRVEMAKAGRRPEFYWNEILWEQNRWRSQRLRG